MARVLIKSDSRYPVDRDRVIVVVERVLKQHSITSELEVSIAVVGKRKMKQVNQDFHGEDYATDVLSFPYTDPASNQDVDGFTYPVDDEVVLGDVLVCYPVAVQQAASKNILVDEEIDFLIEHGMLHLLGQHHD